MPHICVNTWCLCFPFWLTLLCVIVSRPIHATCKWPSLFRFMAEHCCIAHMYHIFFIHSSVDRHLGGFYVLAIVSSAAVDTEVHVSFWYMAFSEYLPRSRIVLLREMMGMSRVKAMFCVLAGCWLQGYIHLWNLSESALKICTFYSMSLHLNKNIEMHMLIICTTVMNIFLIC